MAEPVEPTARVVVDRLRVDEVGLAVVTATPEAPRDPTPLVVTLGILAEVDDSESQRFALLADLLGRVVVAVDTPGWRLRHGRMPARVRSGLRSRDFAALAGLMTDAVTRVHPGLVAGRVSVAGYSLGASTASAVAADLADRGATIAGLDLIEPVAVRPQTMAELSWRNLTDARHSSRYSAQNAAYDWAAARSRRPARMNPLDVGLLAWAISGGGIRHSVERLAPEVPVMIIRGERSTLSPSPAVHRLARQLAVPGRTVSVHVVDGAHHALWNSLRHVAEVAHVII